ncbi:MAG: 4-alpha-glucanotransferase [Oscillospiraceae bacterium]|nr:4-alpha-glucanotransferase [Oscillospiraceae bacterium]
MRASGILMPIFSLPSDYGIGTMGKAAYEFIDFLKNSGQKYWQLLPIGPTSYGDSPYQSFSSFAGNPYFIDFDLLAEDNLLEKSDYENIDFGDNDEKVDYEKIFNERFKVLKKAFKNGFDRDKSLYLDFIKENPKIEDYAFYMAVKNHFDLKAWQEWDDDIKFRKKNAVEKYRELLSEEIDFWGYIQFLFFKQWDKMKSYAKKNGVKLIGDIPIYVASDSADTWANPEIFQFDKSLLPTNVAGCPPDCFSEDGQLWGNPLYRWDVLEEQNFSWWMERIKATAKLFDVIRIDHFRGFESYYSIPYGNENARIGEWVKGPDMKFIKAVKQNFKKTGIIAEDLGFLTPEVEKMLKSSGYPGMKILEFAFDHKSDSNYLPHNYPKNCVVYTGTHDNETVVGWLSNLPKKDKAFLKKYTNVRSEKMLPKALIRLAWSSTADLAVAQMQDFLELDNTARMNEPSTLGKNWQWRMKKGMLTEKLSKEIKSLTVTYRR